MGSVNILNIETQLNARGYQAFKIGFPDSYGHGGGHTFVGVGAGANTYPNTMWNSFFGSLAGYDNLSGELNSFFGYYAGRHNTDALANSFFGAKSGEENTVGSGNSFMGRLSGSENVSGNGNSFFGLNAGITNVSGSNNTAIGSEADLASGNLSYATAIGAGSVASLYNSIYLGRPDGSDAVRIPGAVLINGSLVVSTLGSAGTTQICRNSANRLSPCSSSLRYKTNINEFSPGLSFVRQLRPISFDWKDGGLKDVGFGAEDVAKIDPRFVTYNSAGEVEGVKYDRLSAAFVNAFVEQQTQIASQQKAIDEQKKLIAAQSVQLEMLKSHICSETPEAMLCQRP